MTDVDIDDSGDELVVQEAGLWRDKDWTARVIKNDSDEGWAVEMTKTGEDEPALTGPWTMGRDKKNPKPLSSSAFITLVKTANEVLRRHEQQLHAQLHKSVKISTDDEVLIIKLDIVPDDHEPYALLGAYNRLNEQIAEVRVAAGFKLDVDSAAAWVANDFRKDGSKS